MVSAMSDDPIREALALLAEGETIVERIAVDRAT